MFKIGVGDILLADMRKFWKSYFVSLIFKNGYDMMRLWVQKQIWQNKGNAFFQVSTSLSPSHIRITIRCAFQ